MQRIAFLLAALFTAEVASAQLVSERTEPNQTVATATQLPLGQQAFGELYAPSDVDLYSFFVPLPSDLKVWTGPGQDPTNQVIETTLRLLSFDGVTPVPTVSTPFFRAGLYDGFVATNLAPGLYFVEVSVGALFGFAGNYALDAVAGPVGSLMVPRTYNPVFEVAEQNDPRLPGGVATPSALETSNIGSISVGGNGNLAHNTPGADYDLYRFSVSRAGYIELDLMDVGSPAAAPAPIVHLLNSSFGVVDVSTPNPSGSNGVLEFLSFPCPGPGTYYAAVSGWNAASVGVYSLRISGPGSVGATTWTHPGGCAGSAGVPSLGAVDGGTLPPSFAERPVLGSTYTLHGGHLPANAPLFRLIGLTPRSSPFDLGTLGAPSCVVSVDPASTELAFANAQGRYSWALPLPMNLPLVGLPLEQQLVVLDPAANALGVTASGRVSSVCGILH